MLSNFQLAGRALVQILLLGQPEFRDRIAAPGLEQLRQRVIATHHLEPMEADEIGEYVRHRLELVGWEGRPELTGDAVAALFRFTGGVPRRLNQLLNRVLLHGAVEGLDRIDDQAVEAVADDLEIERARNDNEPVLPLQPIVAAAPEPEEAAPPAATPAPRQWDILEELPEPEPEPEPEPAAPAPVAEVTPVLTDAASVARMEALEARLEEQEATLRRVLTLLVDWAEREHAPWDNRTERRGGTERRFHAV
jgi:general secretion pathway protein A